MCFFPPTQHSYLQSKYTTYSGKAASNSSLLLHTAVELLSFKKKKKKVIFPFQVFAYFIIIADQGNYW